MDDFFQSTVGNNPGKLRGYPEFPSPEASHIFEQLPLLLHKKSPEKAAGDFCLRCNSAVKWWKIRVAPGLKVQNISGYIR